MATRSNFRRPVICARTSPVSTALFLVLLGIIPLAQQVLAFSGFQTPRVASPGRKQTNLVLYSSQPSSPSPEKLPGPDDVTEEAIRGLFSLWNFALATGEARIVTKRYAKDAILMPTISDAPLMDPESIQAYYEEYMLQKPQKRIIEGRIRIGHGWAEDAGICETRLLEATDGNRKPFKTRYSFVYVWEDHQWKILHHHSSVFRENYVKPQLSPEEAEKQEELEKKVGKGLVSAMASKSGETPVSPALLNPARVENLFQFFNDALDTMDSDAVARRFSRNGVIFPFPKGPKKTSPPKNGFNEIKEYFEEFLLEKPQAKILERQISLGRDPYHPTAKDVGTLEWTFRAGGKKFLARYALDFVVEDKQWKIAYFLSSPLPEEWASSADNYKTSVLASLESSYDRSVTEKDVKALFDKWNQALATKDPDVVAGRYVAQQPVLIPSLWEEPLTTISEIKDFYETFLFSRPQAQVVHSHISLPPNLQWCKDVGVLEYEMKEASTNKSFKVRERYSFLYVMDEGEWKIAHHHASTVPESPRNRELESSSTVIDEATLKSNNTNAGTSKQSKRKPDAWQ